MKKNHLISISDLSAQEARKILELAHKIKANPQHYRSMLQGKMFGLVFEKPSMRTWVSFEAGIFSLGGAAIFMGPDDVKLGVREEVKDAARVLDRYLSGLILRTYSHDTIEEIREYFRGVIINALSDFEHPCQALADVMTLQEKFPKNPQPVLAYLGDGNNVLHSLLLVCGLLGIHIRYATPKNLKPSPSVLKKAKDLAKRSGGTIFGTHDPVEAVTDADVIYTDVWVSMGEEAIRDKKLKEFKGMQLNGKLIRHAKKKAKIMHCLPAHRGEEITEGVIESNRSIIFDQAENRLHIQKAILLHLMNLNSN